LRTILYTRDFNENIQEKVNIILSPQFYWIKKIDIPIKKLSDAKKIAKTIFKLDNEHIYGAFFMDNRYFAYAIKKDLKLNIDKKFINNIYLAQTELYKYDKINIANHSIQKVDDLLFCFPKVEDAPYFDEKIELSKYKINLDTIDIDKTTILLIVAIFVIINISLINLIINNKKTIKYIESKKISLIDKYNLPKTSFELDSIISSLNKENNKQIKIRKNLEFITKVPLKDGEYFKQISFDNRFYIKIKTQRNLDFYFKKKFKVQSKISNIYEASLYE
jgi:hypothetical protein